MKGVIEGSSPSAAIILLQCWTWPFQKPPWIAVRRRLIQCDIEECRAPLAFPARHLAHDIELCEVMEHGVATVSQSFSAIWVSL